MPTVTGTVQDKTGATLIGTDVRLTYDLLGINLFAHAQTHNDGKVSFDLHPGTYYCWVHLSSYRFKNPTVLKVI